MIALYISAALIFIIFLILICPVGADILVDTDSQTVKACAAFIKIKVFPSKEKKINIKKLSKKLKKKKISEIQPEKKKAKKKKEKKKVKIERTGNRLDDFAAFIAEKSNDPEMILFLINALRSLVSNFDKSLKVDIRTLHALIETGDAARDCMLTAAAGESMRFFLVFAEKHSKLSIKNDDSVLIAPSFNGEGLRYNVDLSVRIRVISILKSVIKSFIKTKSIKMTEVRKEN